MQSVDVGFTHVAFTVRCLASSIDFYTRYTAMTVIHQREPDLPLGAKSGMAQRPHPAFRPRCWCKVTIRPIRRWDRSAISASPAPPEAEIDEKVALARREGVLRREPEQLGDPVGYFAFFADPDGNTLELSWGQRVGLEVIPAGKPGE